MKHKAIMTSGYVLMAFILVFSLYNLGQSMASEKNRSGDYDWDHESKEEYEQNSRRTSVVANPVYKEECGSCHMAYPAQLLPTASWRKMMVGLDDHFGENAELDEASRLEIENYLIDSSASRSYQKLFRNLGDATPMRITELPYFRHEHDEIPSGLVGANKEVSSLSQCNACHRAAERGQFDEDDISIPGFGRWDD